MLITGEDINIMYPNADHPQNQIVSCPKGYSFQKLTKIYLFNNLPTHSFKYIFLLIWITNSHIPNSRIISSSWIKKYNNVTYYTTSYVDILSVV